MKDSSNMASLHNHDYTSFLDSIMSPEEVVQQAYDLGFKAVALSNHGNMHSYLNGYKKAKELGIKFIFACEVYETDDMDYKEKDANRYHLLLLAKNEIGLKNLFKIVSEGSTRGFYGKMRVDRELLKQHSEGIICTSACLASRIMRLLQQGYCPCCRVGNNEHKEDCTNEETFEPNWEQAKKEVEIYKDIFGDDFYIELQSHDTYDQMIGNQRILKVAEETDTKYIITFDSHMPDGSEKTRDIHRKFIKIAQNSREVGETYKDCYQQNMETMYDILVPQLGEDVVDKAVMWTGELADKCNVELDLKKEPLMPNIEFPKEFDSPVSYLKHLINIGWKERKINKFSKEKQKEYKERIFQELDVLEYLDYIGYFLILHKFVKKFKEYEIPLGYSRGSGAGCLILWIIGVTEIDSIRWDLDFSRFANKGRRSMADYDLDISKKRRGEALELIDDMFGKENVAHLCTFNSLSPKVALKDLGKVFDEEGIYKIPYTERDKMSKLVPKDMTIEESLEVSHDLRKMKEKYPMLFEYASTIQNFPKSLGCHASAIIISDHPLIEHSPYMYNKDERRMLQVEMGNAEKDLSLVKFDFLGLVSLDTVDDTLKLCDLSWDDIDLQYLDKSGKLDDKEVLDNIYAKGNTLGIFQMETQTPQDLFKKMYDGVGSESYTVEDVIAVNAINRPAILSVGMHNNYIKGKKDPSTVTYIHEDVKPIFSKTNSIMLYQEQALQVFRLAGFPEEQVDNARRCLHGDTNILMADGTTKKIKNIQVGDEVISFNKHGMSEPKKVTNVFNNGVKKVNRYSIEGERELIATKEHHVLTYGGYRPLEDFSIGDMVCTPTNVNTKKTELLSKYLLSSWDLHLIGLLIGDGTLDDTQPSFTNSDEGLIDWYIDCLYKRKEQRTYNKENNPIKFYISKQKGKTVDWIYNVSVSDDKVNKSLVKLLDKYNLRVKASKKKIPRELFEYPKDKLANLLAGLFDTDGSCYGNYVEYLTTSKQLAEDVKNLLLQYGIYSYVFTKYVKDYDYLLYRVYFTDQESLMNFGKYILPKMKLKSRAKQISDLINKKQDINTVNYLLPKECTKEIRLAMDRKGYSHKDLQGRLDEEYSENNGFKIPSEKSSFTDIKAKKIINYLYCPETYKILTSDYKTIHIRDIESDIKETEVYDIEVEDNHNYVANDIIVHNSIGKKDPEEMAKLYDDFYNGLSERGWKSEQVLEMWKLIEAQAEYSFNRSHKQMWHSQVIGC